jgi:hypothetical protein
MKEELSASVCCSCEAVRMTVENGADGVGLGASKADLREPRGADGNGSSPLGFSQLLRFT